VCSSDLVENGGISDATNLTLTLLPTFPLSSYGGGSLRASIGKIGGLQFSQDSTQLNFRLFVDEKASDGSQPLEIRYSLGDGTSYAITKANVSIESQETDFQIFAKQLSEFTTSLLVANTGKNNAQAVIIAVGDKQTPYNLGNLAKGNLTSLTISTPVEVSSGGPVEITVYYADASGTRRTKESLVQFASGGKQDIEAFLQTSGSSGTISVGVVNTASTAIAGVVAQLELTGESSIIGNLNAGDYTVVSFTLPTVSANESSSAMPTGRQGNFSGIARPQSFRQAGNLSAGDFTKVKISYTDDLGERRVVERSLAPTGAIGFRGASTGGGFSARSNQTRTTSIVSSVVGFVSSPTGYLVVGALGILLIVGIFVFANKMRRKEGKK
jgi:hypothetical protein